MENLRLRDSNLSWRETETEIVVLDLQHSIYASVRGSGRALWPLLAAGATRFQLIEALQARYEVDEETAARDVDAFVADLQGRNLLQDG